MKVEGGPAVFMGLTGPAGGKPVFVIKHQRMVHV